MSSVYGAVASEAVGMAMRGMERLDDPSAFAAAPASASEGGGGGPEHAQQHRDTGDDSMALSFQGMGAVCPSGVWIEVSRGKVNVPKTCVRKAVGRYGASVGEGGPCGAVRVDKVRMSLDGEEGEGDTEPRQSGMGSSSDRAEDGPGTQRLEVGWKVPGTFYVCSTAAGFAGRGGDPGRAEVMRQGADRVWASICDGEAEADPGLLARYACLCFPEAGRGLVHYWFAFPALPMRPAARVVGKVRTVAAWCALRNGSGNGIGNGAPPSEKPIGETAQKPAATTAGRWGAYTALSGIGIAGYLRRTLTFSKVGLECGALMRAIGVAFQDHARGGACLAVVQFLAPARGADVGAPTAVVEVVGYALSAPPQAPLPANSRLALLFADPSNAPGVPGWPLRNLLALLRVRFAELLDAGERKIMVVCCRGRGAIPDPDESLVLEDVWVPPLSPEDDIGEGSEVNPVPTTYPGGSGGGSPNWAVPVGWDNDGRGRHARLGPRTANLRAMAADEGLESVAKFVSEQASLHVRLMRHARLPGLDADKLKGARVLVLGCGGAGCAALRTLVAWGVRRLVVVDCARVDATHPPRESLFAQSDVGTYKCHAAARALDRLCPDMRSQGVVLRVPLPGSGVGEFRPGEADRGGVYKGLSLDAHEALTDAATLRELIAESDVVLNLLGSSRAMWLPTLAAAEAEKPCFSANIDFDTYAVVRHDSTRGCGVCFAATAAAQGGSVADDDVMGMMMAPKKPREHKMEAERCHLTRPGCAQSAGTLVAELLAASLQEDTEASFSDLPHALHGSLSTWTVDGGVEGDMVARPDCPACGTLAVSEYRSDLMRAYTVPAFGSAGERGWRAAVLSDDDDDDDDDDSSDSDLDSESEFVLMGRGSDMRSPGTLPPPRTPGDDRRQGVPLAVPVSRFLLEKFNLTPRPSEEKEQEKGALVRKSREMERGDAIAEHGEEEEDKEEEKGEPGDDDDGDSGGGEEEKQHHAQGEPGPETDSHRDADEEASLPGSPDPERAEVSEITESGAVGPGDLEVDPDDPADEESDHDDAP